MKGIYIGKISSLLLFSALEDSYSKQTNKQKMQSNKLCFHLWLKYFRIFFDLIE